MLTDSTPRVRRLAHVSTHDGREPFHPKAHRGAIPNRQPYEVLRGLDTTPVFDTYWRFAAARQAVYERRLSGDQGPWTSDPVIARHRFTNCYRATDRVSQYLIRNVAYTGSQASEEVFFRILLFKFFNRIPTWEALHREFGQPCLGNFDVSRFGEFLIDLASRGPIYSAAYVIPQPAMGAPRKATNHLLLLQRMLADGAAGQLERCDSMREAFMVLRAYPGIGDFLAYQFLIDLNYSTLLNFDEMEFVVAGPGARDGIVKCFGPESARIAPEVIRYMSDSQEEHFDRLELSFTPLAGRRRLTLIDCQNLFCETDKYARVVHPENAGLSGRRRIKQRFKAEGRLPSPWFPPKWDLSAEA